MNSRAASTLAVGTMLLSAVTGAADWQLEPVQDAASYRHVAVLHRESADSISDEYGTKEVRPRLEFRCAPASDAGIAVRIDWRRFISSFNTEVQFAADQAEPVTFSLGVDRSNRITATRADSEALLGYLANRDSLVVSVTPYSDVPVSVAFDLAGLDERLDELESLCTD